MALLTMLFYPKMKVANRTSDIEKKLYQNIVFVALKSYDWLVVGAFCFNVISCPLLISETVPGPGTIPKLDNYYN